MFSSNTTQVSDAAPDPQFNYVTMLLHGDGTNGAQNNTFLDSSSNNFTITRNGNTTQGSFSPYGSNWSANLPATVLSGLQFDRLGTTSSFNFMHNASALWTLELWVNLSALPASSFPIFSNNDISSSGIGATVSINSSGQVVLFVTNGTPGSPVCSNTFTTTAISTNSWTHIALVYNQSLSSGNALLFINGVASGSANKTGNSPSASNASLAAELFSYATGGSSYAFNGYASNLRITNSAVYSTAFTPSTTPLTAIANTKLLTFQSNRFVDNSTNAYVIAPRTSQSIQRFNPFGASTAYSTSVIGGSGYFDGSGDYLSVADNSALQFGTGDFTFECWIYPNGTAGQEFIADFGASSASGWGLYDEGSGGNMQFRIGDVDRIAVNPLVAKSWSHVAVVRSGTTATLYVNGTSVGSYGSAGTNLTYSGTKYIGSQNGSSSYLDGYMSNVRAVKGTAVYTSNFTPPTAPLTAITNTSLLLSTTNAAILDNAMMNDLETVGNAQISTSVVKYGTGSLAFDGTGDYLTGQTIPIGSGDLTIECWVYLNVTSSDEHFVQIDVSNNSNVFLALDGASNKFRFVVRNDSGTTNTDLSSNISPSTSTWYHIAGVVSGGSSYLFVNGSTTSGATGALSGARTGTGTTAWLGVNGSALTRPLNGYLDDVRITKGYARYTANFTPPTAAFPNTGPN